MTLVNDELLARLARHRLMPTWALPTAPDGERRGTQPGAGMEFADHRDYHAGDDLRHLDTHAYARLGRPYIKLFAADRGLDIALLVDASPSMVYGTPSKLHVAAQVATALAFLGIAAGDRVRLATFGGSDILRWRPVVTSTRNLPAVVEGIERPLASTVGETDLQAVAVSAESALTSNGLTIVLSDWWTAHPEAAVKSFSRSGRELVAIQVMTPEEEDASLLSDGWTRLVDIESGDGLDLSLESDVHAAYSRAFNEWREQLSDALEAVRGRLFTVRTNQPLSDVLLDDWRKVGFVR